MYVLHVLGVLYIRKFEWFTKTFRYSVILRYVVFTYKNLGMAIDCRLIANWLITIRSVQLTSNLYQNIQIVDMFLFLSLIVINDTERTLWIFCLFFNQNLILKLYYMTIIQREILNKEQTVIKYFHWPCFKDSSTSQNKVCPLQVIDLCFKKISIFTVTVVICMRLLYNNYCIFRIK